MVVISGLKLKARRESTYATCFPKARSTLRAVGLLQKDVSLQNRLIACLPAGPRSQLLEHSELVELKLDVVLIETGEAASYAYFPLDSFVSIILQTDGTADIEVALIGSEGMFNIDLLLGVAESTYKSRVLGPGRALRIHRNALRLRRAEDACLRELLFRYVHVRGSQLARKMACMNSHSVEQRLANSLLLLRDRAHSGELFVTHGALGLMLGVRRESVSKAANTLQNRGFISYRRGYLILHDEVALERLSCACYQADRATYTRILNV